jgi:predicted DNA-binding mobile mystery protein A
MKNLYKQIRIKQLSRSLALFDKGKQTARPSRGWLRAIREALGISLEQIGRSAGATKQGIQRFEKAEASDRITIRNLRRVAEAMDCELIYAIVPKSGTLQELADLRARREATKRVLAVERTMALEDQAPGGVKEFIDEETKRINKKS